MQPHGERPAFQLLSQHQVPEDASLLRAPLCGCLKTSTASSTRAIQAKSQTLLPSVSQESPPRETQSQLRACLSPLSVAVTNCRELRNVSRNGLTALRVQVSARLPSRVSHCFRHSRKTVGKCINLSMKLKSHGTLKDPTISQYHCLGA